MITTIIIILIIIFIYFIPSMIAKNKRDFPAIFLLNIFLGWTWFIWLVCIMWALLSKEK